MEPDVEAVVRLVRVTRLVFERGSGYYRHYLHRIDPKAALHLGHFLEVVEALQGAPLDTACEQWWRNMALECAPRCAAPPWSPVFTARMLLEIVAVPTFRA